MNTDLIIVVVLLVAAIAMFALGQPRMDVVAVLMIVLLPLTGILSVGDTLAGFADPNVILIAALFVIGAGLARTGVTYRIGDWLSRSAGTSATRPIVLPVCASSRRPVEPRRLCGPQRARAGTRGCRLLPFAKALEVTGGVHLIVDGLLGGIFVLTAVIGLFVSNTATAVLMAPIAISTAVQLDVSPYPFAMMVALAASSAFMTPVSSPVNTLVVEPGRYRFTDFLKVGVPFTIVVLIVSVVLVPLLLPF